MRKRTLAMFLLVLLARAADTTEIQPEDLVARLRTKGPKPAVFFVGFGIVFRKHIPGSTFAGPTSRDDGLEVLKAAASRLPRNREVVIYCGCCPWDVCPNVRPALALLKQMGFQRVSALRIPSNFAADWIDHGYPIEVGPAAK